MKIRILPPFYFFIGFVLCWVLNRVFPEAKIIAYQFNYIGIVVVIAGGICGLLSIAAFRRVGTTVKPYGDASALVTGGCYKISRNPMYLGIVLVLLGWAIFLGNAASLGVAPAVFLILNFGFIPREERSLREIFGQDYLDFSARVRRWI
jgi:protein-S-isoprenylcysteine O-methyltransferase Ste14